MGPECTQISNPVMWISCGILVENLLNTDPRQLRIGTIRA